MPERIFCTKNIVWYVLLCLLGLCLFGYSLWKKRDIKLIALYLFISGLTYALEFIVLVILNAYIYYPGVLPNAYFDNILGSVFSNAFIIPMTAVFVAAFGMPFKKYIFIVLTIVGIEKLFLQLGIYRHIWWSIVYTGIGLSLLFLISKWWSGLLHRPMRSLARYVTLYFITVVIHASLVFFLCSILNIYMYRIQWFENIYRGHIAFATLYVFFQSIIFSFLVMKRIKWAYFIAGLLIPTAFDIIFLGSDILVFLRSWNLFYFVVMRAFVVGGLLLIDRYVLRPGPNIV